MSIPGSESVFAVRRLICAARARGLVLDEGPTARGPAFSTRVSLARVGQLWEHAVRELGPSLPLVVAGSIDDHQCLMQFALMSCQTIDEVMALTVKHWRYMTDAFPTRAVRRDGIAQLEFDVPPDAPLGVRVGAEYLLATIARATCELASGAWRPREVRLAYRPHVPLHAWEEVCGVPVRVADTPGLVFAESTLGQPVCPTLTHDAGRFFRELLAWHTPVPAPSLAERVAAALARDLAAIAPTVEQVAAELGVSARSLHRRLAAEGTSYQRVLDRLRCDEALRQAGEGGRPFKSIAAAVGFGDPRAFRRAFKRWTGVAPQQFRQRSLGTEPPPARPAGGAGGGGRRTGAAQP